MSEGTLYGVWKESHERGINYFRYDPILSEGDLENEVSDQPHRTRHRPVSLVASVAVAAPGKKAAPKMPNCSACKMPLVAKKDKMHTMAVKVGGKTYYCCDKCPMGKKKK